MILLIECVVACILFTIPLIIISRNPLASIHDYPPKIIERVKTLGLIDHSALPKSKKTILKKVLAALIITVLCAYAVRTFNHATTFIEGFSITYFIWTIVNWYDALIIDCIWFCHSKRFIIPGTEDMINEYHNYLFHIKGSLKGQLIGISVAFLVGLFTVILR